MSSISGSGSSVTVNVDVFESEFKAMVAFTQAQAGIAIASENSLLAEQEAAAATANLSLASALGQRAFQMASEALDRAQRLENQSFLTAEDIVFQRGTTTTSGTQTLGIGATTTFQIPLNRSDYTHGIVLLDRSATLGLANSRRMHSTLYITDDINDARARSEHLVTTTISTYTANDWQTRAYVYSADGFLSATEVGGVNSSSGRVRITSAYINGSNIDIVLENTTAGVGSYEFTGEFRVWKTP